MTNHAELRALKIATELVKEKLSSSTISVRADGGKATADYFKEVFNGVLEVLESHDCD